MAAFHFISLRPRDGNRESVFPENHYVISDSLNFLIESQMLVCNSHEKVT